MYKCMNGQAPLRLMKEFNITSNARSAYTRPFSNENIRVAMRHVEQFRNSSKYRDPDWWDTFRHDIRAAQHIDWFEYRYRVHYFVTKIIFDLLHWGVGQQFKAHLWSGEIKEKGTQNYMLF